MTAYRALQCNALSNDLSGLRFVELNATAPGPGQVAVAMRAMALNFPDLLMTRGGYQHKPEVPYVVGMEGAGVITDVGEGVTAWKAGDKVCFSNLVGAIAERNLVPASALEPVPDGWDWSSAAGWRVGAVTAHAALVVRGQPCRPTEAGRRLCQHVDRVRLLEQELQGALPALAPEGLTRVALPIAVNADSLATWFAPAVAAFAADAPVLVELAVDDQDHTAAWLRSGAVLAAVTGTTRPPAGFNSRPLGAMRYLAAASPAYVARHFAGGVGAVSLSRAPSLVFNA